MLSDHRLHRVLGRHEQGGRAGAIHRGDVVEPALGSTEAAPALVQPARRFRLHRRRTSFRSAWASQRFVTRTWWSISARPGSSKTTAASSTAGCRVSRWSATMRAPASPISAPPHLAARQYSARRDRHERTPDPTHKGQATVTQRLHVTKLHTVRTLHDD